MTASLGLRPGGRPAGKRVAAFLAAMVVAAVAAFLYIRSVGESLKPSSIPAFPPVVSADQTINTLLHVLLALAVIIVTARMVGLLFRLIDQPAVMGEVVGGIILGPSLLGRIAPGLYAQLLPPEVVPILAIHAQLGVILYMFLVGLELDLRVAKQSGQATIAISHTSIVVPFVLGSGLALLLYPTLSPRGVSFTQFAVFLGVSMSVTAFPVLARILTDRGISRTRMGTIALSSAALNDATAWCLLALVVSLAQARAFDAVVTMLLTAAFVVFVLVVAMPIVRRFLAGAERSPELTRTGLSLVFVTILASAVAAEYIGIHAMFGAFLFGAIMPSRSRVASDLTHRLEGIVAVLFLPAFFAFTGMRTELHLIDGVQGWLLCALIILVACAGKIGGSVVGARFAGLGWRDSSALGVLMNTRGLVELIILNIGLDLQILSPSLFTMLVIMAVVTTFMTTPLLNVLLRKHPWTEGGD
jgi:Kef-type K+ transport system membrane component KefB